MTARVAVLDNEAVQALADVQHPKHRPMVARVAAAVHRQRSGVTLVVPTAVRVEAGVSSSGLLRRLRVVDVVLDRDRADRAAALVREEQATAVDATVAEAAMTSAGLVTVYTSDVRDLSRLLADAGVAVRRV